MNPEHIPAGIMGIVVIVSFVVSGKLETARKSRSPNTRPYRWGYFIGSVWLGQAALALLMLYSAASFPDIAGPALMLALNFTLGAAAGSYIIQRQRWAWVLGTILTLNPVLWIAHFIYVRNRWAEFKEESKEPELAAAVISPPEPPSLFFLSYGGNQYGPISGEAVRQMWNAMLIPDDALVWTESFDDWNPITAMGFPPRGTTQPPQNSPIPLI